MSIQTFQYGGYPIEFEEINGQVMANATAMAKAFGKSPANIFRTITWKEFETVVADDLNVRCVDLHSVKNGDAGGSWIHQELVVEFARRLHPAFALWCNRKIAELMRTGKVELKPMSIEEMMIAQLQAQLQTKKEIAEIKEKVKEIEAKAVTSPTDYFTIAGYASLKGIKVDAPGAARLGKKASSICTANGYIMGRVNDPRFGSVKTYPVEALDVAFEKITDGWYEK